MKRNGIGKPELGRLDRGRFAAPVPRPTGECAAQMDLLNRLLSEAEKSSSNHRVLRWAREFGIRFKRGIRHPRNLDRVIARLQAELSKGF